jgi:prepilin-type N-terminal cleavage/methylation domain-containing protein
VTTNERGFTIVEVLVAVLVLSIGIMALVGSSALVTRMVGRGKTSTVAAQVAARRLERLRSLAASTATPCTHVGFVSGSESTPDNNVTESWVVVAGNTGWTRRATVYVTYKVPGGVGTKTDTVTTFIPCAS